MLLNSNKIILFYIKIDKGQNKGQNKNVMIKIMETQILHCNCNKSSYILTKYVNKMFVVVKTTKKDQNS